MDVLFWLSLWIETQDEFVYIANNLKIDLKDLAQRRERSKKKYDEQIREEERKCHHTIFEVRFFIFSILSFLRCRIVVDFLVFI